jgi:hypothetical protein
MPEWTNILVLIVSAIGGFGGLAAFLNYRRLVRKDEFEVLKLTVDMLRDENALLRVERKELTVRVAFLERRNAELWGIIIANGLSTGGLEGLDQVVAT